MRNTVFFHNGLHFFGKNNWIFGVAHCWPAPFQSGSVIGRVCSALTISVPSVPSQSHHRFSRGRTQMNNNRDRPAKTPYCGVLFATCKLLCFQSFALTSMSFYRNLSPLYDIITGFLKMCLGNDWFWIILHLCINIYFFRFLTPGWYVVTTICSWVFFLCFKADCLPAKETSDDILSTFLGYPRARRRVLKLERDSWKYFPEEFVRRSLIASPLIKPLLTPGGWQEVQCVLKCFSRFIVSLCQE